MIDGFPCPGSSRMTLLARSFLDKWMLGIGVFHCWFGSQLRERAQSDGSAVEDRCHPRSSRGEREVDDNLAPDRGLLAMSSSSGIFAIEQERHQIR